MKRLIRSLASIGVLLPMGLARAAETAAPAGGGMPQLRFGDPLLIAQVVWLLLIFGLLYYVMTTYALPRVAEVLEARRLRIAADLEAAYGAKAAADEAMAAHHATIASGRAEAQAAIAAATSQAQREAAAQAEAVNQRLAAQIAAAEQRIAASRDAAMGALPQVATDTAQALVTKLTGITDAAAVRAAVQRQFAARGA